ncbi:MAG: glycosyltransferase family 39 protein [Patescibacteria group bacterium]|nr:glycosyltransferase family 39 protein [Patescibacteria group bacterium]
MRKSQNFSLGLLVMLVIAGVGVRAWGIKGHLLWQDEAESGIYALQILDVGYPNAEFRGERLYENRSFIPSTSPKYEFESTNFYGSKFEKNKGWLPYYLIAASFKLFGTGTWQARLPAVLLSGFTLLVVYRLARLGASRGAALLAVALQAFNPIAWYYERQARYYSLETLLVVACLAAYLWLRRSKKRRAIFALTGSGVLLFHTHAVAAVLVGVFLLCHWIATAGIRAVVRQPGLPAAIGAGLLLTLPWVVGVRYWYVFWYGGLEPQLKLLWLTLASAAVVAGGFFVARVRTWIGRPLTLGLTGHPPAGWLAAFSAVYFLVIPVVVPAESVAEKQFVPLLPIIAVIAGILAGQLWAAAGRSQAALGLLLLGTLGGGIFLVLHWDTLQRASLYAADWVPSVVGELDLDHRRNAPLVLTDYYQFPLSFYSHGPVQLLYPLRCSYLESYPGEILYVVHPVRPAYAPATAPVEALPYCPAREESACAERLMLLRRCLQAGRTCQSRQSGGTTLYECSQPLPHA